MEEIKEPKLVEHLFEGWQETLIWSCLQQVMGKLYANDAKSPTSVMALIGDFCFLAGEPDEELVLFQKELDKYNFVIMVPQTKEWAELIESCYWDKCKKVTRYAIKKEPDVFNKVALQEVVSALPKEYTLQMMNEELFYRCKEIGWCSDWVAQYPEYEMYEKYGLGAVILKDGEPVSGASSYTSYLGGIEIEIDTKEEYRRKGLAYICGAKLILECLERGWYPSWDAQNKWSVALAEKLGYHYAHDYDAYEVYFG